MQRFFNACLRLNALFFSLLIFFLLSFSAQAAEIKIGAILAETGPASFLGGPEARSLRMLAEPCFHPVSMIHLPTHKQRQDTVCIERHRPEMLRR